MRVIELNLIKTNKKTAKAFWKDNYFIALKATHLYTLKITFYDIKRK